MYIYIYICTPVQATIVLLRIFALLETRSTVNHCKHGLELRLGSRIPDVARRPTPKGRARSSKRPPDPQRLR